jgi:hypothetical protein
MARLRQLIYLSILFPHFLIYSDNAERRIRCFKAKKIPPLRKISFSGTRASLRVTTPNSPVPHGTGLINYGREMIHR